MVLLLVYQLSNNAKQKRVNKMCISKEQAASMNINKILSEAKFICKKHKADLVLFEKEFADFSIVIRDGRITIEVYEDGYIPKTVCSAITPLDMERALMLIKKLGINADKFNEIVATAKDHLVDIANNIEVTAKQEIKGIEL